MDPGSDWDRGYYGPSLVDLNSFKNPSSSPVVLPPNDFYFLSVDGMCSLLDMHDDSIYEILVLHHPLVLRHRDFQRFMNIGS